MVIVDGGYPSQGHDLQQRVGSILEQEGLPQSSIRRGLLNKPIDASLEYLGFILEEGDPRWPLVYAYQDMRDATKEAPMTRLNFENALTAVYLSKNSSRRNGFPTSVSEVNVRQHIRALSNLKARPMLEKRFTASAEAIQMPDGVRCDFVMTDRINMGVNAEGITGCPEAVHQIRLYDQGHYLGRLGFNIHEERVSGDLVTVASITNIQGIPQGKALHDSFMDRTGSEPFNFLIQRLKSLAEIDSTRPIELRGLKNPRNETSAPFYNSVFRREKIRRFPAIRGEHSKEF